MSKKLNWKKNPELAGRWDARGGRFYILKNVVGYTLYDMKTGRSDVHQLLLTAKSVANMIVRIEEAQKAATMTPDHVMSLVACQNSDGGYTCYIKDQEKSYPCQARDTFEDAVQVGLEELAAAATAALADHCS